MTPIVISAKKPRTVDNGPSERETKCYSEGILADHCTTVRGAVTDEQETRRGNYSELTVGMQRPDVKNGIKKEKEHR